MTDNIAVRGLPTVILHIIIVLFFCQKLYAVEVLERRIDVSFRQIPLKEALAQVARQGNFEWSYNSNIIEANRFVSIDANSWTVREILYTLLGEGYQFKANGNYLILKKQSRPPAQLSGYLKDPRTGERVANATVYDRKTMRAVTTDSNGYYALRRTKRNTELVVAKLGYRDTVLQISSQTPSIQQVSLSFNIAPPPPSSPSLQMEIRGMALAVERFLIAEVGKWKHSNVVDSLNRRWQISLLPFVGTNRSLSGKVTNNFSFNIIAGYSKGVRLLEVGGVANFARNEVNGVQMAGAINASGGALRGVQAAGLLNVAGRANGAAVQLAGAMNTAGRGVVTAQVSGVLNIADTVSIAQAGGVVNVAHHASGVQAAGLVNSVHTGTGVQVAGMVNTADAFDGIQVSGFVNRAKTLRGLQIGIFNSARTGAGVQIGLLNRSNNRVLPFVNVVTRRKK